MDKIKRRVLVTGASRGIGLAIAQEFAAAGDEVFTNARNKAIVKDKSSNVDFPADMGNYEDAASVFKKIGPLDVLVNNAGVAHFGLFTDMQPQEWDKLLRNNLHSVLNCTHLAAPAMVTAKRGVIINISSIWGSVGASCEAVYAAAKGAVNAFTRSMAKELGPSGVRVNAVACGAIDTQMNARLSAAERAAFAEGIALMRFGTPQEVAKLVYFLASEAASYVNGQIIGLDGGL